MASLRGSQLAHDRVAHKNALRNGGILTMRVCPLFCLATGAVLDRLKHEYE